MEKVSLVTVQDYLSALFKRLIGAKKSIDIFYFSFGIGIGLGKIATAGASYKISKHIKN